MKTRRERSEKKKRKESDSKKRINKGNKAISINNYSGEDPFTATLDKFIKHQSNIIQNKPANVKTKELCSMSRTQLQANKCW